MTENRDQQARLRLFRLEEQLGQVLGSDWVAERPGIGERVQALDARLRLLEVRLGLVEEDLDLLLPSLEIDVGGVG
jgi:hypothetical protein